MSNTFINVSDTPPVVDADVRLQDGAGNPLTSTTSGPTTALDVQIQGGNIVVDNPEIHVEMDAADGDNVAIKDATGTNSLSISVAGAAKVDGSAVTQPVSAAALPLPTGAATEATLASIDTKLTPAAAPVVYSAAISQAVTAAVPTDIFTLTGSASKVVRVRFLAFGGTVASANGTFRFLLVKRSTANSGGTAATVSAIPHDSNSAAATATARVYTANPTLGTAVGTLHASTTELSTATATPAGKKDKHVDFEEGLEVVLRGTNEVLAMNLAGQTIVGLTASAVFTWIEE